MRSIVSSLLLASLCTVHLSAASPQSPSSAPSSSPPTTPQSTTPQPGAPAAGAGATKEMAAAMAKARRYTQPGDAHKALGRFVGKWSTETRFFMMGKPTPAEKGTAEFAWMMPGRWLKLETAGTMMGNPVTIFMVLGYDNFKQSYVGTNVSSLDTAMTHTEGDMDPSGQAMILYGTIDEYLTGEHDKMVKYLWRFPAPDRMVLEIHDLPIGETNTKVLEITYVRTTS